MTKEMLDNIAGEPYFKDHSSKVGSVDDHHHHLKKLDARRRVRSSRFFDIGG